MTAYRHMTGSMSGGTMHLESKVSQTEFSTGERGIIPAVGIRSFPATPRLQFMYPDPYFWNGFEQPFNAFDVVPMAIVLIIINISNYASILNV